ncbi:hypothetical protein IMSAGC005_03032 [Lachnospiraceae bacterium]|nr:hypothetical protein IMSAGC005_03032 [Lachnospiraceae bacterium]
MFWIKGRIDEIEQKICYEVSFGHGLLTGDEGILFLVNMELDKKTIVGPIGQYVEANIDDPLSVLFVIRDCFDEIVDVGGEIPEADTVPEGCIS